MNEEELKGKPKKENKKTKKLELELEEYKNNYLKVLAELQNYRKRKEEETARLLKYANEDLVLELINVTDNFERAIKLDDNNLTDELSKFLEGFKLIYGQLQTILTNFEVKAIDGANKPFDPTYHQAVLVEHQDGIEPGIVLDVMQKGYLLKDRVIRPAMVKVSE